ncbi:Nr1i3 [Phodopus roborovskii]|uniref:Nr1i3 protein n=1 Tax=Phodopus roborovskii TaxID=109678 RepID=A0AAU9ZA53_PHORO|nr:Nr1i3 [Phodopus roborovskii]
MTATLTLETMASGEEYEPRNCVVCGDRATGYHFHALTCEGCKGFFRRTVSKTISPICPFSGSCEVSKAQRRHCPACRLQKCLNAGMRKDMILSAEALALRRARQAQRRAQKASLQLSQERKELVQTLVGAHTRHVGPMFDQFVKFRPPAYLFIHHRPSYLLVPSLPLLAHFADINTFMVQQIIKFTKEVPLFRPGITQREEIDQMQEEMALILNNYIMEQQQRPQSRFLYAKLMGLLAELRSINNAYSYEIERIQGLSAMMPLLREICS